MSDLDLLCRPTSGRGVGLRGVARVDACDPLEGTSPGVGERMKHGHDEGGVIMNDLDLMTPSQRRALAMVAEDLQVKFRGVFGQQTVEKLVEDSFNRLAAKATVTNWLVLGTERFARERLEALVHSEDLSARKVPAVLFLCVHNAGRSQMALGWFKQLVGQRAVAWSSGSEPGSEVNSAVVGAMAEVGIDLSMEFPKPWTDEFMEAADVVVTMGCGDACPLLPGKHYEDWEIDDPTGKSVAEIRPIRDEIGRRIRDLLDRLDVQHVKRGQIGIRHVPTLGRGEPW